MWIHRIDRIERSLLPARSIGARSDCLGPERPHGGTAGARASTWREAGIQEGEEQQKNTGAVSLTRSDGRQALLEKAAAAGDTDAMRSLGLMYRDRNGVAQDCDKARQWFLEMAAFGDAFGMVALGYLYRDGKG